MTNQTTELLKKIYKLGKEKREYITSEYYRLKLNKGSARALRFFGFHYLHTGRVGLRFLFLLSCCLYVGGIRWIIQACMLNQEIEKKNYKILENLYMTYK